jgi:UDP-N-acetylglucosamine 2-epimerase
MHILSIVGARPQFVKAAMLVEAVRAHNRKAGAGGRVRHTLVHTGQHYDRNLSDVFFQQLPLPKPQYHLGVGSGSHGKQTAELLEHIEEVLLKAKPDVVVAYGDTNSTVAGGLAAAKLHIALAHVEAGLRSFNRRMPEEINRVMTDHLSDVLFCPTDTAIANLKNEGITKGVYLTGDVMLDAVLSYRPVAEKRSRVLKQLDLRSKEYVLLTVHRAENTDSNERIEEIVDLLMRLQQPVVFPIHPRTRHKLASTRSLRGLAKLLFEAKHMRVIDPVSYLDMLALEDNARLVMTDSGGVQKEAYFLGVPCLTLREETEWVETLEGGWNRLVGADPKRTVPIVNSLWNNNGMRPVGRPNLAAFGGGKSAAFMVQKLMKEVR